MLMMVEGMRLLTCLASTGSFPLIRHTAMEPPAGIEPASADYKTAALAVELRGHGPEVLSVIDVVSPQLGFIDSEPNC